MSISKKITGGLSWVWGAASVTAAVFIGATSALAAGGDMRPAGVPADFVITPNGYFHPSCIQQVADDEMVQEDGSIRRADGSVRNTEACRYPRFTFSGLRIEANATSVNYVDSAAGGDSNHFPAINGWTAYSETNPNSTTTPDASIQTATFNVPTAPTSKGRQVVYFFPGLQQGPSTKTILQPVLGWNAFNNDQVWTIASWNCCESGTTYNSTPVTVNAGDEIYGSITGTCATGQVCTAFNIVTKDQNSGQSTTLSNTGSYGQKFNWYFGGVLEMYNVNRCTQLPASGSVSFTNIDIYDINDQLQSPTWSPEYTSSTPQCSYKVTTTTNSTTITFKP